jgi:hypothetical protein
MLLILTGTAVNLKPATHLQFRRSFSPRRRHLSVRLDQCGRFCLAVFSEFRDVITVCYPEVYRRQQQLLAESGPAEDIT